MAVRSRTIIHFKYKLHQSSITFCIWSVGNHSFFCVPTIETKANSNFFTFSLPHFKIRNTKNQYHVFPRHSLQSFYIRCIHIHNVHISLLCTLKIHFSCTTYTEIFCNRKKNYELKMYSNCKNCILFHSTQQVYTTQISNIKICVAFCMLFNLALKNFS